jgi:hypothetical protein
MIRIVRTRTLRDLEAAVLLLRDDTADQRAAHGCCGCGAWMADVVLLPPNAPEGYCLRCVRDLCIGDYEMLPGR